METAQPNLKKKLKPGEGWQIVFILALLILPFILGTTIFQRVRINNYLTNGIAVEATVADGERTVRSRFTTYDMTVYFFEEGAISNLRTAHISKLMNNKIWENLQDTEVVYYLPDDPENNVLFEKSLQPEYWSPLVSGLAPGINAGIVAFSFVMMKLRRRFANGKTTSSTPQ